MKLFFLKKQILISLALCCVFACQNKEASVNEQQTEKSNAGIITQADSLLRNVEMKWTEMEHADKVLLENSRILADSIATLNGLNKSLYDSITYFIAEIKNLTYNQKNISDGDNIEVFDHAVTDLVQALEQLQKTTEGGSDCVVCNGILKAIKNIDNEYVIRRKKYDTEVNNFNIFIEKHQAILKKENPDKFHKLPLFSIME